MPAALLLAWHPSELGAEARSAFERVAGGFPRRVRAMTAHDVDERAVLLRTWTHDAAVGGAPANDRATGSWLTTTGNPTRPGLHGDDVLERLLDDCARSVADALDALSPPYALVYRDGRDSSLHVAVDRCGLQHLYLRTAPDGTVWVASSLLALAALGASVDHDAAAEWLAAGHFVSERTLVREVRKLGAGERLRLDAAGCATVARWYPGPAPDTGDDAYRRAFLDALRASDDGPGTAAELTGGLDSRLVLAGRIAAGLPTLSWTVGDPRSAELRTVRRLQRRAGFEHIGVAVPPDRADLPELVHDMHELADGEVNALEYAPLLVAFDALAGRRRVSVSGSGGEIGRAYYYAALDGVGGIDAGKLTHKVASATGPVVAALARERFPDPLGPLRRAVDGVLAGSRAGTPERVLEDFYIRARMQRFGGRNVTTTGHFCRQALPFFDNEVVAASLTLPPERKRDGRVVRSAIAAWAPALARIPLDSGMAVAPRSRRRPDTQLRWAVAMGRKALVKFGGRPGRTLAFAPPDPVPWDALRATPAFHELVRDLLPPSGGRSAELLDPAATVALVDRALAGGSLYPLGLVLTLELTLRRLSG